MTVVGWKEVICLKNSMPERKVNKNTQVSVPGTKILIDEMQEGLPIGERVAELMDPRGENLSGPRAYQRAKEEYQQEEST